VPKIVLWVVKKEKTSLNVVNDFKKSIVTHICRNTPNCAGTQAEPHSTASHGNYELGTHSNSKETWLFYFVINSV